MRLSPSRKSTALAAAVCSAGLLPSAVFGQDLLHSFDPDPGHAIGRSLAVIGDVDGDGRDDFAITEFLPSPNLLRYRGSDFSLLARTSILGDSPGAMVALGDVTGDGIGDLAIGFDQIDDGVSVTGGVQIVSGSDGALARLVYGTGGGFGRALAVIGDVDGDGVLDYAVGAPELSLGAGLGTGAVTLHSGADDSILRTLSGDSASQRFGAALDAAGDLDHDGVPDLLVGDPTDSTVAPDAGCVWALSGADGSVLLRLFGLAADEGFGIGVVGQIGDVDHDSYPDFVVTGHDPDAPDLGRTIQFAGRTGGVIRAVDTNAPSLRRIGDLNGDGCSHVAVGRALHCAITLQESGISLGTSLALDAGDVDRDGYDDFLSVDLNTAPSGSPVWLQAGSRFVMWCEPNVVNVGEDADLKGYGDHVIDSTTVFITAIDGSPFLFRVWRAPVRDGEYVWFDFSGLPEASGHTFEFVTLDWDPSWTITVGSTFSFTVR